MSDAFPKVPIPQLGRFEAEVGGIIYALLFIASSQVNVDVHVYCDNQTSMGLVQGNTCITYNHEHAQSFSGSKAPKHIQEMHCSFIMSTAMTATHGTSQLLTGGVSAIKPHMLRT
eukprot:11707721-Karenia_brevis.AAC.1